MFVIEYRKRHFPGLCCLKTKVGKMTIFGPKAWVLEYRKKHFSGVYCLKKKTVGKIAIFGAKPWVNPFAKMSIFRLFKLLVFIA